jgi:hypothetical protein
MFENQSLAQPLHDAAPINGTTCLPGGIVEMQWGVGTTPTEWSNDGFLVILPYSPLVGDVYATWNTGVVPAGTYTLRARVHFGESTYEETRVVTVQHRSTTIDVGAWLPEVIGWAENGDTIFVQSGTYAANNLLLDETIQLLANGPVEFVANSIYPAVRIENSPFPATISGITIRSDGYYNTRYGITVDNSRLNLLSCKFIGIHGVEGGGLVASGASSTGRVTGWWSHSTSELGSFMRGWRAFISGMLW